MIDDQLLDLETRTDVLPWLELITRKIIEIKMQPMVSIGMLASQIIQYQKILFQSTYCC